MRMRMNVLALVTILALITSAAAQAPADSALPVPMSTGFPVLSQHIGAMSMHMDNMDVAPVKGAPFCATVTTEHTQLFADGNRIHTTDSSTMCRDAEGRTRREASLNLLGAAGQQSMPKMITIIDPVAGFHYMLDSENKIAHKMAMPSTGVSAVEGAASGVPTDQPPKGEHIAFFQSSEGMAMGGSDVFYHKVITRKPGDASDEPTPATENLGDQSIGGVHATGTRMITTIPSGKMGNDQPIVVTSERWYSPDLRATVMTKHSDPWAGELKTQFASVNTSEPDPSLFTVPSDYKVEEEKDRPMLIQLPAHLPPSQ